MAGLLGTLGVHVGDDLEAAAELVAEFGRERGHERLRLVGVASGVLAVAAPEHVVPLLRYDRDVLADRIAGVCPSIRKVQVVADRQGDVAH